MLQKKVSVIIVSYNVQFFLELCLDSVMRAVQNFNAEIIVVDNDSSDNSCKIVTERFPAVTLIANKNNAGFSKANNQGLAIASGEYIHYLNPDTVLPEDFFEKTIPFLDAHPEIGALGPRIIDGRGQYAPDSKKSFPSLWTSIYKITGLSTLFPRSKVFNNYYAAHIGEHETSPIEILSGCCMLVRNSAMIDAGGGFDEAYFMYCEDFDLCHRLTLKGYQNYYYPETTIIHYKGESTRKLSYRYMKIFYGALRLFVKKYYPKVMGTVYITALKVVLALRNILNWCRHLFSLFKMFLLDAILLTLVTMLIKNVWFDAIVQSQPESNEVFIRTIPIFVAIWMLSLFFNGAYDKPFSLFRAGRGMVLGTVVVLAGYGLMPFEYRYSRGVVLFSGMTGTVGILLMRWLLSAVNWIKLVPRGKMDYKAALVSDKTDYVNTALLLNRMQYNLEIVGRVAPATDQDETVLGNMDHLPEIQQLYRINEFIFSSGSLSYKEMMHQMERCAPHPFYKIHTSGSEALVGSNNSRHHAEEFSLDKRYRIGAADAKRNKRIVDIGIATLGITLFPLLTIKIKDKHGFWQNSWRVLRGKMTWVGYSQHDVHAVSLPGLKQAVLPPYTLLDSYAPDQYNYDRLAEQYAANYSVLDDLRIIWINLKYLGQKKS